MMSTSAPLEVPIWQFVQQGEPGECWSWTGVHNKGRARIGVNGKNVFAYRVMYELLVGPIPQGLTIDHLCSNPGCVNPEHLEPVTATENRRRHQNKFPLQAGVSPFLIARRKLTSEQVLSIAFDTRTAREVANSLSTTESAVRAIRSGRRWGWLTGIKFTPGKKWKMILTDDERLLRASRMRDRRKLFDKAERAGRPFVVIGHNPFASQAQRALRS